MNEWLTACAEKPVGLSWDEFYFQRGSGLLTCGNEFVKLFSHYQQNFKDWRDTNRAHEKIGTHRLVLVATSLVVDDGADAWFAVDAKYRNADLPLNFTPSLDDFRIGYFGREEDLNKAQANLNQYYPNRFHAQRFFPIAGETWQRVLPSSPAEPFLSSGVILANNVVSLGGWADPLDGGKTVGTAARLAGWE